MATFVNDNRTYTRRQRVAKQEARKKALEGTANAILKLLPHLDPGERLFESANELWDSLEEATGEGEQPRLDVAGMAAEIQDGMRREGYDDVTVTGWSRDQ